MHSFLEKRPYKKELGVQESKLGPIVQNLMKLLANMTLKYLS